MAADTTAISPQALSEFAYAALKQGMVYFSAWGPDCGRFHDVVDEVILEDDVFGERLFVGPMANDTIITTWHEKDTLDETLEFFFDLACPTDGFADDSHYWVAAILGNPSWAATVRQRVERSNSENA